METIDGTTLASGSPKHYLNAQVIVNNCSTPIRLYVIRSPHAPLVLGLDWLQQTNPSIDWTSLTLEIPESSPCFPRLSSFIQTSPSREKSVEQLKILGPSPVLDNPAELLEQLPEEHGHGDLSCILQILPQEYHEFASVFSKTESIKLPEHRKYDMAIEIEEGKTIPWGPIYSLSEPELKALKSYLDENLAQGYIQPSKSRCSAPIFFVKKKSGELRPVVDYRGLNRVTVKNRYPLPLIPELINRFSKARIFTKIDLRGAYNLVRIREGDEWKTAFRCRFGQFEYRVMPFGLTNAPAVFQHLMNDILHDLLDIYCVVYLDDILIYSETLTDHSNHVKAVLARLKEHDLYAKLEKCQFSVNSVEFLGYTISSSGIGMDPSKVNSVLNLPVPSNIRQLQSFLGFSNFYRMFVPNYTRILIPLLSLLKKDVEFVWTNACQSAFVTLKQAFTQAPVLLHADNSKPFFLETDASDFAIAGILSQMDSNEQLHPVAYYSRKLTTAEVNYEIHDKELLAIIASFHQWRSLLVGSPFPVTVYTDHKNLLYFTDAKHLNRRQVRWSLFLTDFNYHIIYRPGKEGEKPDALSRRSDYQLKMSDDQVKNQFQSLISKDKFLIASTHQQHQELSLLEKLKIELKKENDLEILQNKYNCIIADDLLMFKDRIYVPKSERLEVLKICHDNRMAGHPGNRKTFQLLSKSYWWPSIRRDCKSYVESCQTCCRSKTPRAKPIGLLQPLPVPPRPWHSISMDIITDLPMINSFDSVLVVVDRFTKLAHLIPCSKNLTSAGLADLFLKDVVRLHGLPSDIVSDRGTIFVSQFWTTLMKSMGIQQKLSSSYHPQTDGQTERVNQCVEQYIRCYSDYLQQNWLSNLPLAEYSYNSTFHSAIQMSPFFAAFGYDPPLDLSCEINKNLPSSVQESVKQLQENFEIIKNELKLAQESARHFANKSRRQHIFKVGDLVYLNRQNIKTTRPCAKLDWKQLGPFKISDKVNDVAYRLELPQSMSSLHNVFHASLLQPMKESNLPGRIIEPPPPLEIENDQYYEVEDILDCRQRGNKFEYLVSWIGYGPSENTWLPAEELSYCQDLVKDFHHRYPDKR